MRLRYVTALAVAAALLVPASMSLEAQATPAPVLKKSAPPLRGQAELGFIQAAKLEGNTIVTTFQVKNMSATNAIVGLQISEFWYDKAGNPLQGTGDRQRLRAPLQPLATLRDELVKRYVELAIERCEGDREEAAKLLEIGVRTLYRYIS